MKFPQFSSMTKVLALRGMVLLTLFISAAAVVNAQKSSSILLATEDLDGCQNGARNTPELTCSGSAWSNGNLNQNNSQWVEGEFVPVRVKISGLVAGSTGNTITISYDTTKDGKHTFDYLGTYDASTGAPNGPGGNDPCSGVSPCASPTTFPIPDDPNIPVSITQLPGNFTMWNGTITSVSAYTLTGTYAGTSTTSITLTYSVDPGVTNVVLAFGAHIGTRLDWGVGNTAIDLSGSPYHLTVGGGQLSMKVDAAIFPAVITIIKEVRTLGAPPGTTATFSFNFNFTQGATVIPFSLVDDVSGDGPGGPPFSAAATEIFTTTSFGAANGITVTEANYSPTWTLSFITCVETAGGLPNTANTTVNLPARTANIIAEEAEFITCTFRNTQFQPTAAHASVSGRTVDSFGNGIANTRVVITDAQTGESRYAITNPFGYYTIEDLEVGSFYFLTVSNKRYTFVDDTRTFTLNDSLSDVDFVANP